MMRKNLTVRLAVALAVTSGVVATATGANCGQSQLCANTIAAVPPGYSIVGCGGSGYSAKGNGSCSIIGTGAGTLSSVRYGVGVSIIEDNTFTTMASMGENDLFVDCTDNNCTTSALLVGPDWIGTSGCPCVLGEDYFTSFKISTNYNAMTNSFSTVTTKASTDSSPGD